MILLNIINSFSPYQSLDLLLIYLDIVREGFWVIVAMGFSISIALISILAQRKMKKEVRESKGLIKALIYYRKNQLDCFILPFIY